MRVPIFSRFLSKLTVIIVSVVLLSSCSGIIDGVGHMIYGFSEFMVGLIEFFFIVIIVVVVFFFLIAIIKSIFGK